MKLLGNKIQNILSKNWKFLKNKVKLIFSKLANLWKNYHLTKIISLLFLSLALGLTVFFTIQARQVNISALRSGIENPTSVLDQEKEVAGNIYAQKGKFKSIEEISTTVQDGIVATEDQRFMKHRGFDPIGIGRAALGYFLKGEIIGGGSTITQQLAKNAYLTADQTMVRKFKELFLAIEIEKYYTKKEILEMYLNNSYFGNGVWGVQDASRKYFNKDANELSLSEGATIAGMLKAPSNYNPIDHYERSIERRNLVLSLMRKTGKISEDEKNQAVHSELAVSDGYQKIDDYRYPYYFDAVISEAINEYDFEEEEIINGGYKIYTNLNQKHQQKMDEVYADDSLFESSVDGEKAQSASIAIEPKTGGVSAVVGGRGDHVYRGFNRATQMRRQPGSVIKPLSVYAPALESGYEITDLLKDEKLDYGDGDSVYSPSNYDDNYLGEIPIYQALAESKNAATVWLLDEIGIKKGFNKAKRFGIKMTEDDYHYGAVALGGMSKGSTPMEVASAYTVFANDGIRKEPHFIQKIVDPTGAVVVDNMTAKKRRVLSKEVTNEMNRMLLYVFSNGSAQSIQPSNFKLAGKTGTTQTKNRKGATDQWLVAYTPDLVISSWQGYDNTNDDHYLTSLTSEGIGQVMKKEFEAIKPYTEEQKFMVSDDEISEIIKDKKRRENIQKIKEGFEKGEEVLRSVKDKAETELKKAADGVKNLIEGLKDR
ncbi:MAG: PBP1A family penicillin-binding protein [Atopostipes sp.]|nr:PBP1A family penicillin-binding protein [Atopostipes sp.]